MALTNSLKEIRLKSNLHQSELASAIGSCSRTIGRIERGERNPSLELALKIAHFFDISVEDIFSLEQNDRTN